MERAKAEKTPQKEWDRNSIRVERNQKEAVNKQLSTRKGRYFAYGRRNFYAGRRGGFCAGGIQALRIQAHQKIKNPYQ